MWDIFIKVVAHNLQKLAGPNQIPFWTDGTPSNVWRDAQNFTVSWFTLKILLLKHEPTKYWCPWLYENNFLLHNVYINIDINFDDLFARKSQIVYPLQIIFLFWKKISNCNILFWNVFIWWWFMRLTSI